MSHVTFFFFFLRGGQNDQNCRFIPTVKLQCHFTARMVFSFQSAVCVTCALISQATDEAPLLQQQSVQQNQVAPDAGFQPWVHTHPTLPRPSHPSLLATLLGEPWTHYCHRHFLFSACVLTSGLARYAHYFISLSFPITHVLLCNGNDFHAGLPRFDMVLFRKWLCAHGSSPFQFLNRDSVLFHGWISLETTMLVYFSFMLEPEKTWSRAFLKGLGFVWK